MNNIRKILSKSYSPILIGFSIDIIINIVVGGLPFPITTLLGLLITGLLLITKLFICTIRLFAKAKDRLD